MVAVAVDRCEMLLASIRDEFPRFRLVRKDDSRLQRAIHHALRLVTFGRMNRYLSSYQTTIGWTIYVTADWDERSADERYVILRHELVHLRQFRRFTRPGMSLLYLIGPLPAGLAAFRARFEQEAYAATLRATAEVYGLAALRDPELREHVVGQFTGSSYGWMWPFRRRVERWYDGVVGEIERAAAAKEPR